MIVTSDSEGRVILPSGEPGDRFDVQISRDGRIIFTRLESKKKEVIYSRENGLLLAATNEPISWEETRQAMDELP